MRKPCSSMLTRIMGKSGRAILEALVDGEADPDKLLTLVQRGIKAPPETLRATQRVQACGDEVAIGDGLFSVLDLNIDLQGNAQGGEGVRDALEVREEVRRVTPGVANVHEADGRELALDPQEPWTTSEKGDAVPFERALELIHAATRTHRVPPCHVGPMGQ